MSEKHSEDREKRENGNREKETGVCERKRMRPEHECVREKQGGRGRRWRVRG